MNTKDVWVAWTNTDLTEGRGESFPIAVCKLESTAIRVGKGRSVMGSNCYVSKEQAIEVDGKWYYPNRFILPTIVDTENQKAMDTKKAVIKKATELGLTEEEIKALKS